MSSFTKFITKHFGGIPKSLNDLRWLVYVNPNSVGSSPKASEYRVVSPGSQPDYVAPTPYKVSDNQYYKRDVRRAYPQTVTFSPQDLASQLALSSVKSIASGEGAVNGITESKILPVIINNRYKYTPSSPHLKPDASNPEFCIRGVS
ncbi:hypothetical protein BASA50_010836 [Batrachochytrium salamandrivorans]|uniref:NADH dehydrogenase [ubiquinone] 1 alpha subcomplex subunit 7 n=1 Tax=Batrachochytrium salamandrivorans TaxID=1357716 RepID=A0ABQ8EXX8_9FUNG|nr:hypothetical protein BASA50_010836 [Batrachochytrium salamandrivorans]KAH6591451.1 hypothetical protein BASA61_004962 [Batrachochytrium salamandrivorans]KAH9267171.1 hypothetical protein BASA83_010085 [Batrachochytrium salamandrivorans]